MPHEMPIIRMQGRNRIYHYATYWLSVSILAFSLPVMGQPSAGDTPSNRTQAEAYYTQGREEWNKRTEAGLQEALRLFKLAIEKDPRFAPALAGLADAYSMMGDYRFRAPREVYPKARAAAEEALSIDPKSSAALTSIGWISCIFDWDLPAAEAAFKEALASDPHSAITYHFYSFCMGSAGKTKHAEELIERARSLDPHSLIIRTDEGVIQLFQKHPRRAITIFENICREHPEFITARFALGQAYLKMGRPREAVQNLEIAAKLSGRSSFTLALLGEAYWQVGKHEDTVAILDELLARRKRGYVSALDLASLEYRIGGSDAVWRWLERACQERSPWMLQVPSDHRFSALTPDPRWRKVMEGCGLPRLK